jgi:rhodanese-related sulfurtransferase
MKIIQTNELKEKLENNDIALIEVLDEEQFKKSHIKGAIHIPLEKISTLARQKFEKDKEIVVYCSDHECTASPIAGKKLEGSGFSNIYHYKGGKKAWKEAGLPMA